MTLYIFYCIIFIYYFLNPYDFDAIYGGTPWIRKECLIILDGFMKARVFEDLSKAKAVLNFNEALPTLLSFYLDFHTDLGDQTKVQLNSWYSMDNLVSTRIQKSPFDQENSVILTILVPSPAPASKNFRRKKPLCDDTSSIQLLGGYGQYLSFREELTTSTFRTDLYLNHNGLVLTVPSKTHTKLNAMCLLVTISNPSLTSIVLGTLIKPPLQDFENSSGGFIAIIRDPMFFPVRLLPTSNGAYWPHLTSPHYKIHFDGGYRNNMDVAPVVVWDSYGDYKGYETVCFPAASSQCAEDKALGVHLADRLHLNHRIVEDDAEVIINYISRPDVPISWQFQNLIIKIRSSSLIIDDVSFAFVHREFNGVAHDPGQFVISSNVTDWWSTTNPPDCIRAYLFQDEALV